MVQHAAASLSRSLFFFLPSLPHLSGTLYGEISHCVMVMEKDGVEREGSERAFE